MTFQKIKNKEKIIIFALSLTFFYVLTNFYRFYLNNSIYEFDPWLTNYQGGFVRRGLIGEFFIQIHYIFSINPAILVLTFVSCLFFLFYFFLFKNLKKIKINNIWFLIIFSPLGIFFPILNSKATGHKEIMLFAIMACFCFYIKKIEKMYAFLIICTLITLMSLTYEVLIFYCPYLLFLFFCYYKFKNFKENFYYFAASFTILIFLTLINFLNSGDQIIVEKICESLKGFVNSLCNVEGNIAHLGVSIEDYNNQKGFSDIYMLSLTDYFLIYGFGLIYGIIGLVAYIKNIKINLLSFQVNLSLILFLLFLIPLPIYYLGADWGRYIHISYICTIILILFLEKYNLLVSKNRSLTFIKINKISPKSIVLISFIYGLAVTVPLTGDSGFKFGLLKFFL